MELTRREAMWVVAAGLSGLMGAGLGGCMGKSGESGREGGRVERLPRAAPGSVGVDAGGVAAFLEEMEAKEAGLHSMMLLRRGRVVAECWWDPCGPGDRHALYSLSKSFTSTAVGLAVAERRLTVDDRVASFFPEKLPGRPSDHLLAMRVKDLLTMTTGHAQEPRMTSDDWVRDFLHAPVPHRPGTHFLYNTPATHVLSAIVERLSGQDLVSYLKPRLFGPLGIEDFRWERAPSGVVIGGYGLSVRTEDVAVFGQMYLQRGHWQGRQVVPAAWVDEATAGQVSNGDPATGSDWNQGYGYQFWRSRHDSYRGDGAFGQYCLVLPRQEAVVAITGGVADMAMVMSSAWTHLLPAMRQTGERGEEAARAGPTSQRRLEELLRSRRVPVPTGAVGNGVVTALGGRTWQVQESAEGIETLRIDFGAGSAVLTVTGRHGTASAACGYGRWVRGRSSFPETQRRSGLAEAWSAEPMALACGGREDGSLEVRAFYYESPFIRTLLFRADGNELTVKRRVNVAFGPMELPTIRAMGGVSVRP